MQEVISGGQDKQARVGASKAHHCTQRACGICKYAHTSSSAQMCKWCCRPLATAQLPNTGTHHWEHVNVSSQGDYGYLPEADEEGTCVLTQHIVRADVAKLPAHIANVPQQRVALLALAGNDGVWVVVRGAGRCNWWA